MTHSLSTKDYVQMDMAEFALCLEDFAAIADALELLAVLITPESFSVQGTGRMASSLHVLGDYLSIRSLDLQRAVSI